PAAARGAAQTLLQALPRAARPLEESQALVAGTSRNRSGLQRVRLEDAEAVEQERMVLGLLGLSEVQEHAGPRARRRGDDADPGPHDRLQVRQVRQADGDQDGALRRI